MKAIIVKPDIYYYDHVSEFIQEVNIQESDLIVTNQYIYEPYFKSFHLNCHILFQEEYGKGEPSEPMLEAMIHDLEKINYNRVIGIGGGTILDICKYLCMEPLLPIYPIFKKEIPIQKTKKLVLVPTTCGTGSEVTNISVVAFPKQNTKIGLALDSMYASSAVLIPELLETLPFQFFATSSIDALIHAIESSLSPKATDYTKLFGYKAIELILKGYKKIVSEGKESRKEVLKDFSIGSNYAGLAFGLAGCGAIHAMSYPLSGTFHVAHGEANYAIFMGVMNYYYESLPEGKLIELFDYIASILECDPKDVLNELEKLLDAIITKKSLSEYGASKAMLEDWSKDVVANQQRLLVNAFVPMNEENIHLIYSRLF